MTTDQEHLSALRRTANKVRDLYPDELAAIERAVELLEREADRPPNAHNDPRW